MAGRKGMKPQSRFWNPPENLPLGFEMFSTSVYGRFVVHFMGRPLGYLEREKSHIWHVKPDLNAKAVATMTGYAPALKRLKAESQLSPERRSVEV